MTTNGDGSASSGTTTGTVSWTTSVPSAIEGVEGQRVINWQTYLWEEPKLASASDIQAAESKLNVVLPDDYKAVVAVHQGQSPTSPNIVRYFSPDQEAFDATPLSVLFHYVQDDPAHAQYHIAAVRELLSARLPEGVIPFGEDPGGSYLAFDYRVVGKVEDATGPFVVYLDNEADEDDDGKMKTIFLANSFTTFLGQLRTEDEITEEMEAAVLVGGVPDDDDDEDDDEDDGEYEEVDEEVGEGEAGGGDDDVDDEDVKHVTKRRKNEEGEEHLNDEEDDNDDQVDDEDDDDDDDATVGDKRKNN